MRSGRAAERGYNLVALAMIITVLAIAVTSAIPLWSSRIRRDREEELISRGFQYAEAIRVFQKRFGRLPNRLEELIQVEPRSIRQLWKNPIDPMTGDDEWGLRSYQDDPDSQSWGGEDVYDVYSLAEGKGLNGVPYSQW